MKTLKQNWDAILFGMALISVPVIITIIIHI